MGRQLQLKCCEHAYLLKLPVPLALKLLGTSAFNSIFLPPGSVLLLLSGLGWQHVGWRDANHALRLGGSVMPLPSPGNRSCFRNLHHAFICTSLHHASKCTYFAFLGVHVLHLWPRSPVPNTMNFARDMLWFGHPQVNNQQYLPSRMYCCQDVTTR